MDLSVPLMNSLTLGCMYTMMALGLTMSYSVTKISNFAHAELVTLGGYITALGVNYWGLGLPTSLALSFVGSGLLAILMDELVYKPLIKRGSRPLFLLVASIGVGLVVRYLIFIYADLNGIITIQALTKVEVLGKIGRAALTTVHLWVFPISIVSVILLHLMFHHTKPGKALRAMADNEDLARVSGIRIYRLRRFMWIIAGGITGIAGGLWAVYSIVTPETGWMALLRIFAASILGGLTSFWGTIAGGIIIGLAENVGISVMNEYFNVSTAYRPLISFVIIVMVFLFRPSGLAGVDVVGWVKRRLGREE
ncbi:MAG: hypothetical protein DRJ43_01575 [Thermoprotei archaeon]|nr:MAG: hypothetical protein DRJ43_01575 [Thermoprotei archaeon]